jgi:hypothetical protein
MLNKIENSEAKLYKLGMLLVLSDRIRNIEVGGRR